MIDTAKLRQLILSTDMTFHYDLLQEANNLEDVLSLVNLWDEEEEKDDDRISTETLSITEHDEDGEDNHNNRSSMLDDQQKLSFMKIVLHAADISNTVRIWPISKQWSDLIVQEFFQQGDAEKEHGLQVSPGMNRELATQPSISLKFGDYLVKPYFEAVTNLLPSARIFLTILQENRLEWLRLKESPLSSSITHSFLQHRPSSNTHSRRVNVPAGTIALPNSPTTSTTPHSILHTKPMPILRTSSHSNLLISPPESSTSAELRRKSVDHRKIRYI